MKNFFVTGLPRSRTAWLSLLLSTGNSICYHELFAHCNDLKEFNSRMNDSSYVYIGNSDSGLPLYWDKIKDDYPYSKIIYIHRDKSECINSISKELNINIVKSEAIINLINSELSKMKCTMYLDYDMLDTYRMCNKIFNHIYSRDLDYNRWEMLHKMKISVLLDKLEITNVEGKLQCLGLQQLEQ